jgi:hypothetical protein
VTQPALSVGLLRAAATGLRLFESWGGVKSAKTRKTPAGESHGDATRPWWKLEEPQAIPEVGAAGPMVTNLSLRRAYPKRLLAKE